jgi:hypothetical protein
MQVNITSSTAGSGAIVAILVGCISFVVASTITSSFSLYLYSLLVACGQQIRWENCFRGGNKHNAALTTVDGTDFWIRDSVPRSSVWWTPKFNGPAHRYELACSLYNGDICWYCGPFAPRTNPDIRPVKMKSTRRLSVSRENRPKIQKNSKTRLNRALS